MYFTAEPSPNEKFGAKIDELEQRLNATEGSLDVLSQEVRNLKRTLETAGDSLSKLSETSSDHANRLGQIETILHSVTGRVQRLEQNANTLRLQQ